MQCRSRPEGGAAEAEIWCSVISCVWRSAAEIPQANASKHKRQTGLLSRGKISCFPLCLAAFLAHNSKVQVLCLITLQQLFPVFDCFLCCSRVRGCSVASAEGEVRDVCAVGAGSSSSLLLKVSRCQSVAGVVYMSFRVFVALT